jgi:hypothetical protein
MEQIKATGRTFGQPAEPSVRAVDSVAPRADVVGRLNAKSMTEVDPEGTKWEATMEVRGVRFVLPIETTPEYSEECNAEETADQIVRDNLEVVSVRRMN